MIWETAGERDIVPTTLRGLPDRVKRWVLDWLDETREGCEHVAYGVVRYSAMGATRELCGVCAAAAHLDRVGSYCGRCATPLAGDDYALRGIYAFAPDLIAVVAVCGACLTEPERT